MYFSKKIKGIVIKRRKHQEADLILTIFSESLGKIEARARGLRKAKSKMAGQLELFNLVKIELHRGRFWDLIIGAESINNFSNLKANLKKLVLAHFFAEFVDKFTPEGGKDIRFYNIFRDIFLDLDRFSKRREYLRAFIGGEVRLLKHLGLTPCLDRCLGCGALLSGGRFKLGEGGVYCPNCSTGVKYSDSIDQRTLSFLSQETRSQAREVKGNEQDLKKVSLALAGFFAAACLERPRALEFIKKL